MTETRQRHSDVITGSTSASIAASVEEGVRAGLLAPGTSLPTVRALAVTLTVSTATVADAYRALRLRGIVRTHGRRGTTVADRPPLATGWSPAPPPPGLHNLVDGNPDSKLLPPLGRMLAKAGEHALYGDPRKLPELVRVVLKQLRADGVPATDIAVVGGAIDAIGRVLDAHLTPGDVVGVEDPTFPPLFDLLGALGLVPEPIAVDANGPIPDALGAALSRGIDAVVVSSRAQNPTGALVDAERSEELRRILKRSPKVLVIEDDTGGLVVEEALTTVIDTSRSRWAFVRSFSMMFGPDLRTGILAADDVTLSRVEGRQRVGTGWVSHILQRLSWMLLTDDATTARVHKARRVYSSRRQTLVAALAARGIDTPSLSGFHVWVPVPQETGTVAALQAAGWAVAAGEPFRLKSSPGIRLTASRLSAEDASAFADALAHALRSRTRTYGG
jgi:DNA-binding transcriptional MocR family regulator